MNEVIDIRETLLERGDLDRLTFKDLPIEQQRKYFIRYIDRWWEKDYFLVTSILNDILKAKDEDY